MITHKGIKPSIDNLKSFSSDGLLFELVKQEHVFKVHEVILQAFAIWKSRGFDFSPSRQTYEQTMVHALNKAYLIFQGSEAHATVSVETGKLEVTNENIILSEAKSITSYQMNKINFDIKQDYLVFKKFAVIPSVSKQGLGLEILGAIEKLSQDLGFQGVVLETAREADWLHKWYCKQNYIEIGIDTNPNHKYQTVLLAKSF